MINICYIEIMPVALMSSYPVKEIYYMESIVGQFSRIVWIKNSWAMQIDPGHYEFRVGSVDNKLGVDFPHKYFIAEGSFYGKEQLTDAREIELDVFEMDTGNVDSSSRIINNISDRYILDIDLDYFSTANPFLKLYTLADCYEQLKFIFKFQINDDFVKASARRREQLKALELIFEHLQKHRTLFACPTFSEEILTSVTLNSIEKLLLLLYKHYEETSIDWMQIFNAGLTTDDQGLPHHLSTDTELEIHFKRFESFLKQLPFSPICVTISCSAVDDYTPQDKMPIILDRVLNILRDVYKQNIHDQPIRFDGTENFTIMKL